MHANRARLRGPGLETPQEVAADPIGSGRLAELLRDGDTDHDEDKQHQQLLHRAP